MKSWRTSLICKKYRTFKTPSYFKKTSVGMHLKPDINIFLLKQINMIIEWRYNIFRECQTIFNAFQTKILPKTRLYYKCSVHVNCRAEKEKMQQTTANPLYSLWWHVCMIHGHITTSYRNLLLKITSYMHKKSSLKTQTQLCIKHTRVHNFKLLKLIYRKLKCLKRPRSLRSKVPLEKYTHIFVNEPG